jgi:ribosomal protein S18 acetylase RimI-like enzyme
MEIVALRVRQFQARGSDQWNASYPTREVFARDQQSGSLYVLRESGIILGAIVLNETQSPEYTDITWQQNETAPLVVHRLCVDPTRQRKGAANRLMDFAEDHARQNGYTSIRLDTHAGNPAAITLYERRGCQIRGYLTFRHRNLPVVCFELLP